MALTSDLISQFVKATNDTSNNQEADSQVRGTVKIIDGQKYVQLDGSELYTPVSSNVAVAQDDRVIVEIKNHTANILGSDTSPAAKNSQVMSNTGKIDEFTDIISYSITSENAQFTTALINSLIATVADIQTLTAYEISAITGEFESLRGKFVTAEKLNANDISAINAEITNLKADLADIENLDATNLSAINAEIDRLSGYVANFTYVSADVLAAQKASIEDLTATKLSATSAALQYANIDFANIGDAAIRTFFTKSGMVDNLVVNSGHVTGKLVGVTISGDLIEGNTVKADKLVILGDDGIYYKLNATALGASVVENDNQYKNGISGSVLIANSVTAEKVNVSDLVAFNATIGGLHISNSSVYSGVKSSASNTTAGIYFGSDGQFAVGDSNNYLRFFDDGNGSFKLAFRLGSPIGGRNLILNSGNQKAITSSTSPVYIPSIPLESGKEYTVSINVTTPSNITSISLLSVSGGGNRTLATMSVSASMTQTVTGTFTMSYLSGYTPSNDISNAQLGVSSTPVMSSNNTVTINWIKVESGTIATDWTPAPEDAVNAINDISVGGRNLILNSNRVLSSYNYYIASYTPSSFLEEGEEYTISINVAPANDVTDIDVFLSSGYSRQIRIPVSGTSAQTITGTFRASYASGRTPDINAYNSTIELYRIPNNNSQQESSRLLTIVNWIKCERGNKATDWTPAPEDINDDISGLNSSLSSNTIRITQAETSINALLDSISTLVRDSNGESLMHQTATGWSFSINDIQSLLSPINSDISDLSGVSEETIARLNALTNSINDLGAYTDYITFDVIEGSPAIILGETDSDFKLLITNTDIRFLEGSQAPVYINNQTMSISKAEIREELKQGGFVWQVRSNGNYGLAWKG